MKKISRENVLKLFIIPIVLVMIMFLGFNKVNAISNITSVSFESENIKKGETVKSSVSFSMPVQAVEFEFEYDSSKLGFSSASIGEDFYIVENGKIIVTWFSLDGEEELDSVDFTFTAIDEGIANISIGDEMLLADGNLQTYEIQVDSESSEVNISAIDKNKRLVSFVDSGVVLFAREVVDGETVDISDVNMEKEGYIFEGWYEDATFANKFAFTTPITKDVFIYANWEIKPEEVNKYKVTFKDCEEILGEFEVEEGSLVEAIEAPTKTGFVFDNWYTNADYNEVFNFYNPINGETIIYAKYNEIEDKKYNVIFIKDDEEIASEVVIEGRTVNRPTDPTKQGYNFIGWFEDLNSDVEFNFNSEITKHTTLYAKFEKYQYSVTYKYGDKTIDVQNIEYNGKAVRINAPEEVGYSFDNWYEDATYTNVYDFNKPVTQSITIYAKYDLNEYTVTFKYQDETIETKNVLHGNTVTSASAPEKTGRTFAGWYKESNFVTEFNFEEAITETTTIYAKYDLNEYTVTFMYQDEIIETRKVLYGNTVTSATAPEKTGKTFAGWYGDITYTNTYDFNNSITKNTTIYAKYDLNEYAVTFMYQNEIIETRRVLYGDIIIPLEAPVKTGRTFAGWYKESNFVTEFNFEEAITGTTTIYAKYDLNEYTVTFMYQNEIIETRKVLYGNTVTLATAPEKTGKTFAGWYGDITYTNTYDFNNSITKNTTIYAKYDLNEYAVTFMYQNEIIETRRVLYGDIIIPLEAPVKTGRTFAGWYKESNFVTEFNFEEAITGTTTIYAKYDLNEYTVTYKFGEEILQTQKLNYGSVINGIVAPEKIGYTFEGWYEDATLSSKYVFGSTISDNLVIYANYVINTYDVIYKYGNEVLYETKVNYGEKATILEAPVKEGKTFDNWYSDESLTIGYDFTNGIVANTVIYAKYITNTYTVTFNSNGGSGYMEPVTREYGLYNLPDCGFIAPEGKYFKGWSLTRNDNLITSVKLNVDIEVYAIWEDIPVVKYTVEFDSNGGTGVMNSVSDIIGYYRLPENSFTAPEGYRFKGWSLSENGEVVESITVSSDTKVFAIWERANFRITLKEGSNVIQEFDVENGSRIDVPLAPEKVGYTFEGWYEDATYTTRFNFNNVILSDLSIYAKYTINTYTVTYVYGADVLSTTNIKYNELASSITAPEKIGKTFDNWYSDENLTIRFDFTKGIVTNTVIYAKYNTNTYTVTFNSNGGTGIMNPVTCEYGLYNLPENSFTAPEGYRFKGWSLTNNGNLITSIDVINNVEVYAIWEIIPVVKYTVEFDSNGGTGIMSSISEVVGTYNLPENLFIAPEGYRFKGWSLSINGDIVESIIVSSNVRVYAIWEEVNSKEEYKFIEGINQEVDVNSNEDNALFRVNAEYSLFEVNGEVYVDDILVDKDNYISRSGSVIIELKNEYLKTLSEGTHKLSVKLNTGDITTTEFSIIKTSSSIEEPVENTEENIKNDKLEEEKTDVEKAEVPKTYDNIVGYVVLLVISVIVLPIAIIWRKSN